MAELTRVDAKMVQKRSTVTTEIPTIPASEDHTDGTWSATDVYSAELFVNEADKKMFIRIADEIREIAFVGGGLKKDVFDLDPSGGGQSVFTLSKDVIGDFEVWEDGAISIRSWSKTDTNELTSTTTVPEGTRVTILY